MIDKAGWGVGPDLIAGIIGMCRAVRSADER
jgi:hypothetical protein